MSDDLHVGVAGATGALGKEILRVLDRAPWRPGHVSALASARTSVPFVEYGEAQLPVDDLADQVLGDLDALLLAVPAEVAREVGGQAMDDGVPTVDCSGAFADDDDVPMLVPWINPEALEDAVAAAAVTLPSSPTLLLAAALGPLVRAGLGGPVEATVMVPSSFWGRDGIEELSRQVVALFNAGTPPRKVFPSGLAFDLLPQVGPADESGWTAEERRVTVELDRLLGLPDVRVTLVGAPVFSGISANVRVRPERIVPTGLVAQVLRDGGVVLPKEDVPRQQPRPRRVEGHPFVHAGRLRADPDDGALHLWLAMDNLRATAAAAVACAGALVRGRAPA